ncbi:hypothetical protein [Mycobacterium kansasii]|uniref:hypothetical protein n=1 Tax=Mycobacterium kansasii TaxID=1768 RepID=UPI000CDDBB00|nr:hypothetical protein [Mycobacterium kansasii]POY32374.1 hypothetical protein C3478_11680 [Mycobacterium kansasii]
MVPFSVRLGPAIIGFGGQPNSCDVYATVGPPPRDLGKRTGSATAEWRNGEIIDIGKCNMADPLIRGLLDVAGAHIDA